MTTLRERWARQPQSLWIRRALFQVHLCTGLTVGLYMIVISVTGSLVVFRGEWNQFVSPPATVYTGSGPRLTEDELRAAAQRAYPDYQVSQVFIGRNPDWAVEIWFKNGDDGKQRLFQPYTAADLGDSVPLGVTIMSWLVDLHDNLLADQTGRTINGVGAICLTLLCTTGAVIWWPGSQKWRRSAMVRRRVGWKRFTWELHSAVGFWTFVLLSIWALSGIYMAFPEPFLLFVDFVDPPLDTDLEPRPLDDALQWLTRLHFGRYFGLSVKVLWVILGLAPSVLFMSGAIVWWNRVLVPARRAHVRRKLPGVTTST